jgi:hypothetical protein
LSNLRLKFQELVEAVAHDDERRYVLAELHYLFAMKCAAMRLGEELHDLDDVRYLLRHLENCTRRRGSHSKSSSRRDIEGLPEHGAHCAHGLRRFTRW